MKTRIEKKDVLKIYKNVIKVPYCKLQHVLKYKAPDYYTVRREGWAADLYELDDDTIIVTGYEAFGTDVPHQLLKEFDDKAYSIDRNLAWEKKETIANDLLEEFLTRIK